MNCLQLRGLRVVPQSDVCPMTELLMAAYILPGFFFNTESMLPLWWLPLLVQLLKSAGTSASTLPNSLGFIFYRLHPQTALRSHEAPRQTWVMTHCELQLLWGNSFVWCLINITPSSFALWVLLSASEVRRDNKDPLEKSLSSKFQQSWALPSACLLTEGREDMRTRHPGPFRDFLDTCD